MCSSGTSSGTEGGWVPGVSLKHPKFYPYCQWPNHHLKKMHVWRIWNSLFDIYLIFKTHKKNPYSMLIWYSKQPYICNTNPEMRARRISINSLLDIQTPEMHVRYSFDIQDSPISPETNARRISNSPLDIHSIFKTHPKSLFDIHLIFKTALCAKETRKRMSDEYRTARWIFIRYSKHTQKLYLIFI